MNASAGSTILNVVPDATSMSILSIGSGNTARTDAIARTVAARSMTWRLDPYLRK
jgi:hypothetical protein